MLPERPFARDGLADAFGAERESAAEDGQPEEVGKVLGRNVSHGRSADVIPFSQKVVEGVVQGKAVVLDDQTIGRRESPVQPDDHVLGHRFDASGDERRFGLDFNEFRKLSVERFCRGILAIADDFDRQQSEDLPRLKD